MTYGSQQRSPSLHLPRSRTRPRSLSHSHSHSHFHIRSQFRSHPYSRSYSRSYNYSSRFQTHILYVAICVVLFLPTTWATCKGVKEVQVRVQYKWIKDTDAAFPNEDPNVTPGFTQLFCASTRKEGYAIWRNGEVLSTKIINYIKAGRKPAGVKELKAELDQEIKEGIYNYSFDRAKDYFLGDEATNLTLTLNGDLGFTYINCIARITPSADWFIGIYDISMCDENSTSPDQWATSKHGFILHAYDGGVFDTTRYDEPGVGNEETGPRNGETGQDNEKNFTLNVRRVRTVAPRGYGELNITIPGSKEEESSVADDPACFPANALVTLHSTDVVAIHRLSTHHRVLIAASSSAPSSYSSNSGDVFSFSHRDSFTIARFIRLSFSTPSGRMNHLLLTGGHYIYRQQISLSSNALPTAPIPIELVPARQIRLGDSLLDSSNHPLLITSVQHVYERGLYAPHTIQGELIVNGVRVSCFTTAVPPTVASVALAPLRLLHHAGLHHLTKCITHYLVSPGSRVRLMVQKAAHRFAASTRIVQ